MAAAPSRACEALRDIHRKERSIDYCAAIGYTPALECFRMTQDTEFPDSPSQEHSLDIPSKPPELPSRWEWMDRWSMLRAFGRSRLVRTSFFWLLALPVLARLLLPIAGEHEVVALEKTWLIHIGLPFHWIVLYAAAVFFALGQLVYIARCPTLPDRYSNASDFLQRHPGEAAARELRKEVFGLTSDIGHDLDAWKQRSKKLGLKQWSWEVAHKRSPLYLQAVSRDALVKELEGFLTGTLDKESYLVNLLASFSATRTTGATPVSGQVPTLMGGEPQLDEWCLWSALEYADRSRPQSRYLCGALFFLGIVAFLLVSLQGLVSVLKVALT